MILNDGHSTSIVEALTSGPGGDLAIEASYIPQLGSQPGSMTLLVSQYGVPQPQPLGVQGFAEPAHFDGFELHAGDAQGVLKGSRLDEVASLSMKNVTFMPGELSSRQGSDELPMTAVDADGAADLTPERGLRGKVTLKDGRLLPVTATIDAARPKVTLINRSVQSSALGASSNIQLANPGELPLDATLVFSLRAQTPASFARDETIDVATGDEGITVTLSQANRGLTLENSRIAVVTLNPLKSFGASSYGPLKFRVDAKGVAGDWQPLATLVRLPILRELDCPATPELACRLSGTDLYLLDSLSANAEFTNPVSVPDGFLGLAIPVPHPSAGTLFLKLRDDPHVVNPTSLTAQQLPALPADSERTDSRQSALRVHDTPPVPPANP